MRSRATDTSGARGFMKLALLIILGAAAVHAQNSAQKLPPTATDAPLSLEQVFEIAARDNLQVNAVRRRLAVAEAGISIAGQRPNPDFITSYTRSEPRLNLSVSQPVELGGKRGKRIAVARNEAQLTQLEVDTALRQLRRDVRAAYFSLALARDNIGLGQQTVEQAQKLLEIAEARFEAGDIAQFEVMQARLGVERATNELARLENAELAARAPLNLLLNRALEMPLTLLDSLFANQAAPFAATELITRALSENVEVRTAEQQIVTEQSRLRLTKAQRIPDLLLEPGIESFDPSLPNNYAFKMQVTVPLPIFNRNRGEIARSNALVSQLSAERDALRQRIASEIGQAALRVAGARQQVEFYETKLLPDAQRVLEMALESYRAGQTGVLPVMDAQRNVREVRQAYLQALFDYQTSLADLELATGVNLR